MYKWNAELYPIDVAAIEEEGVKNYDRISKLQPGWVGGAISKRDALFLSGFVKRLAPKKCVEIGVASGWSSFVILDALRELEGVSLLGIDSSKEFYLERSKSTGGAIVEVDSELAKRFTLFVSDTSLKAFNEGSHFDFAFIDANHRHPWPTLDLISVLPFMDSGSWVALHDINLTMMPRHNYGVRGPYYTFHLWPFEKVCASGGVPMIGAIRIPSDGSLMLDYINGILATPWEVKIEPSVIEVFVNFMARHFGSEFGATVEKICTMRNKS